MNGLADYHYPKVYKQLLGYVEHHEMKVLHSEGLYRHLRFITPGTGIGHFDLITWPGSLAIRGDIGEGFIFSREDDMIPWFNTREAGHINPGYWSEKLSRGTREARQVFSDEKFEAYLSAQITDFAEAHGHPESEVRAFVDTAREWDWIGSTESAHSFMEGLSYEGERIDGSPSDNVESWLEYDHHFLLACHAILWGVRKYVADGGADDQHRAA